MTAYINECETDINAFITAVKDTLEHWLALHTDAVTWAEDSFLDYEDLNDWLNRCTKNGVIENNYFSTDVKAAALKRMAMEYIEVNEVYKCSVCQRFMFVEWGDCEDCWETYQEEIAAGEELEEPEQESLTITDLDDLIFWLEGFEPSFDNAHIYDAMVNECFADYREGVQPYTAGIEEEIEDLLTAYEEIEDKQDLMIWALKALSVWHVNGEIIADYGDRFGLDDSFASSVREDGFSDSFGEDVLLEWLES